MNTSIKIWPETVDGEIQPRLDLYLLDQNIQADMVLILPGGGYRHLSEREGERIAYAFNQQGFQAAVLWYRVVPSRFPEPQQDAIRAIRLLRANQGLWSAASGKIAVCGFSAGGHLAACTGTIWNEINADAGDDADKAGSRPDAMVLCYPVIAMREFGHSGSATNLLGPDAPDEVLDRYSLQNRVTPETPPAYIWHTATDGTVPVANSVAFATAMWQQHIPAELHVFPRGGHGKALAPDMPEITDWVPESALFLRTQCGFAPASIKVEA